MADCELLYKLVAAADIPADAWSTRNDWTKFIAPDKETNFISLLTEDQVAGAAERMFAGRDDIQLLSFSVEKMCEEADLKIKYEAVESAAGGSGPFAHAHGGGLPYACLVSMPAKILLSGGKLVIPPLGLAKAAAEAAAQIECDSSDASSDDDGLPAFDQHTYDLDDSDNELLDP